MTDAELAQRLYAVRQRIRRLKDYEDQITERLTAEMVGKTLEVPGIGVFEKRRSASRKGWKHEDIKSALIRQTRDMKIGDPETGETLSDFDKAIHVLWTAANPSWRQGGLKQFGLDPDEFVEVTPGRIQIQIHADMNDTAPKDFEA